MSRSVCCAKWCLWHYLTQQRTKKSALFNATPGIWAQIWSDSSQGQMSISIGLDLFHLVVIHVPGTQTLGRKPRNPTENVLPDGCCHAHHQRPHQPRGDPQLPNCRIFVNHQTTHAAVDHKCVGNRHHHRKPGRKRTTLPQKRTKTDNLQNNGNDLGVRWECSVRTRLEPDRSSAFEAPFHATEKVSHLQQKSKKHYFTQHPQNCEKINVFMRGTVTHSHLILIHENGCYTWSWSTKTGAAGVHMASHLHGMRRLKLGKARVLVKIGILCRTWAKHAVKCVPWMDAQVKKNSTI